MTAKRYFEKDLIYHITQQCHNKQFLLESHWSKELWINLLKKFKKEYCVSILNFTVMDNHIHLLISESFPKQISLFSQALNSSFTKIYNRETNRTGSAWNQRPDWTPIENNMHLVDAMLYIDFNSVRAGLESDPREYWYCGCRELVDLKTNSILDKKRIHNLINTKDEFKEVYSKWIEIRMGAQLREIQKTPRWKIGKKPRIVPQSTRR